MAILQTSETNTKAQEAFWSDLQQFRFDLFYYCNHYKRCITILRWIKYIVVGVTSASTLVWMNWSSTSPIPIICSIIILLLQVFNAVSDLFPFNQRKDELRDLTNDLDPLYIEMESTWRKIVEGELTLSKINKSIDDFANKRLQIERNYLKNDFLKEQKKIVEKTEKQTQEYFDTFK